MKRSNLIGVFLSSAFSMGSGADWWENWTPDHLHRFVKSFDGEAELKIVAVDGIPVTLKIAVVGGGPSGWMVEDPGLGILEWSTWKRYVDEGEHRRAERHRVGYTTRAAALLSGYTTDEAAILGQEAFETHRQQQFDDDKSITLATWSRRSMEAFVEAGVGEKATTAGAIVSLFPGYGQAVGAGLLVGGSMVTAAEANYIAKKAAKEKKTELLQARAAFIRGEITEEEYLSIQRSILMEVGEELQAFYGQDMGFLIPEKYEEELTGIRGVVARLTRNPLATVFGAGFGVIMGGLTYAAFR